MTVRHVLQIYDRRYIIDSAKYNIIFNTYATLVIDNHDDEAKNIFEILTAENLLVKTLLFPK